MHPQDEQKPSFSTLGLSPKLLEKLTKLGFTTPTPIQAKAIPVALEGKDIIGIAQTGTGKTFAFSLPMMQAIAREKKIGLVLLPTRELALQVEEEIMKVGGSLGVKTAVLIGGASMYLQTQKLRARPHIIIATPGRLIDHLEQKNVSLAGLGVLVLDEADRMLDMGFAPQINRILENAPTERQTLLFSATMPPEILTMTKKYMKSPERVEIERAGTAGSTITQSGYAVEKQDKAKLLHHVLKTTEGTTLVFTRTKHGARKLSDVLNQIGHRSAEIHSNRSLAQRKEALAGFKSGKYRTLIATDIASRGIDVNNIRLVVNFDLPEHADDYIHRIGRTGRAGKDGHAISFVSRDERRGLRNIERLMRRQLDIKPTPKLEDLPSYRKPEHQEHGFQTGGHRGQPRGRESRSGRPEGYRADRGPRGFGTRARRPASRSRSAHRSA